MERECDKHEQDEDEADGMKQGGCCMPRRAVCDL